MSASQNRPCSAANEPSGSAAGSGPAGASSTGPAVAAAPASAASRCSGRRSASSKQLSHDAEGELALELGAAGGQHERPAGGDVATHLGQQPGLADPRRAVDQQHAAVAAERGVGRALELGDLAVPFDQVVGLGHGRDIR